MFRVDSEKGAGTIMKWTLGTMNLVKIRKNRKFQETVMRVYKKIQVIGYNTLRGGRFIVSNINR